MTSTSVKDVGSAFANLFAGSVGSASASTDATSFRQVWDGQVGKGSDTPSTDVQTMSEDKHSDMESLKTDNRVDKSDRRLEDAGKEAGVGEEAAVKNEAKPATQTETSENENSELSEEEMKAAMEALATVAAELMQNVAEAFGVTMEELQTIMKELDLDATDVLDGVKLGELMLQLGGASDSYALVTDEALYDTYRMLMDNQKVALETVAKELGMEQPRLDALIAGELQPETAVIEEMPDEMLQQGSEADGVDAGVVAELTNQVPEIENAQQPEQSTTGEENSGRQNGRETASETPVARQGAEFVAQNLTTENLQAQVQQTESIYTGTSWDTDTQNIMRQIMDYMKIQVNAETTNLEMQLHPASLGTVRVNLASNGGVVTANFVTENEAVKAALESQMVQLRETFAEQGVKIEAIEVTVQTHEFEQNLEQGRGRDAQESGTRRNRTRRINLNDPLTMEHMDEEDALAAEMLTAGGSTVDYTA